MTYYFGIHTGEDFDFGPYRTIVECRRYLIEIYDRHYKKRYPTAALPVFSTKNGYEGSVDEDKHGYFWIPEGKSAIRRYINKNGTLGKNVQKRLLK